MYNYALNECNIIKKVYTSPVTRFSSRASPPKIRVSSEISVLYCLPNKKLSGLYQHSTQDSTQALRSKSSASYIHLEIEEHIYTIIVSFMYLLIIELLYGKISAGRLLWMSEHY